MKVALLPALILALQGCIATPEKTPLPPDPMPQIPGGIPSFPGRGAQPFVWRGPLEYREEYTDGSLTCDWKYMMEMEVLKKPLPHFLIEQKGTAGPHRSMTVPMRLKIWLVNGDCKTEKCKITWRSSSARPVVNAEVFHKLLYSLTTNGASGVASFAGTDLGGRANVIAHSECQGTFGFYAPNEKPRDTNEESAGHWPSILQGNSSQSITAEDADKDCSTEFVFLKPESINPRFTLRSPQPRIILDYKMRGFGPYEVPVGPRFGDDGPIPAGLRDNVRRGFDMSYQIGLALDGVMAKAISGTVYKINPAAGYSETAYLRALSRMELNAAETSRQPSIMDWHRGIQAAQQSDPNFSGEAAAQVLGRPQVYFQNWALRRSCDEVAATITHEATHLMGAGQDLGAELQLDVLNKMLALPPQRP